MEKETIGLLSALIIVISAIPYGWRVWQGKIKPNITTWGLWSLIGLSLLLTYRSSGAGANAWPTVFGFINPSIITALAIWQKGEKTRFNRLEKFCIASCLFSLVGWWYFKDDRNLVQYALYTSILADGFASIPTIAFIWRSPSEDRPFAWASFALAYGLAMFAISEHTVANYALPIWMLLGASVITAPLIWYRLQNRIPLREWI